MSHHELPLRRDPDGQVYFDGTGPVSVHVDFHTMLGNGGQGAVFMGRIFDVGGALVREVAVKVNNEASDPLRQLQAEAAMHAEAWASLDHVLTPLGFIDAHDSSDTPAMLILEIGLPLEVFLGQAGPLPNRHASWIKAIARIILQLLRFIVSGDTMNLMHKDIKMQNMFVINAHSLELATLAVGDFGAAQRGVPTVTGEHQAEGGGGAGGGGGGGGGVSYRVGVYTWKYTSPRMASFVYDAVSARGVQPLDLEVDRQLTFYNDLFGWSRIAFTALADRRPPDTLFGPCPADYAQVPEQGRGQVPDAVRTLLLFALDVLTMGSIDDEVSSAYVQDLAWYHQMPRVFAGNNNNIGSSSSNSSHSHSNGTGNNHSHSNHG